MFARLLLAALLTLAAGCNVNIDVGPYSVGSALGDLAETGGQQCPPSATGVVIEDEGDSCRVSVVYEGVFVDGAALTSDVDAGIAAAATVVGRVTRVKSGTLHLSETRITDSGTPPAVSWRDVLLSVALDGGTEHTEEAATAPNASGLSYSVALSSADLAVVNAVLDAPTTSDLSGSVAFEGSLSVADTQILSAAGVLSIETSISADLSLGL